MDTQLRIKANKDFEKDSTNYAIIMFMVRPCKMLENIKILD